MSLQDPARSRKVERRDDAFATKLKTRIWEEEPSPVNPFVARSSRCHGYDLLELLRKRSYIDVLYLLFRGELPAPEQAELLEKLAIACINPGPRHPATRAAMNAGVGKTDPHLILPIGLTVLGGEHLGAAEVEPAIRWLRKHSRREPSQLAAQLLEDYSGDPVVDGDHHLVPGFGCRFAAIDEVTARCAAELLALDGAGRIMRWAADFAQALNGKNMGWLSTGLVAACLADLGFQPRSGGGLFQLLCAPGLFAHGIEMANRPLTAMPFPDDSDYFIEEEGDRVER